MYVCAIGCKEQVGVPTCGSNACKGFYHKTRPCCWLAVVGLGGGMCAVVSNLVFASLVSGKRDSRQQVWCFGNSSNVFFLCLLHGIESHSGGNVQGQEPKSRSLQLLYIPVTAFSQTALFLDRISLK